MPKGVPVATFAIGEAGAANAALHVIATLAATDDALHRQLLAFRARQTETARTMVVPPQPLPCHAPATGRAIRMTSSTASFPIAPGAWPGMHGGGQVGRSCFPVSQNLGLRTTVR